MPRISKTELIRLQKTLVTDEAIGNKFGVTRQAIHQMRQIYGIPSSYAGHAERNEKIVTLYTKGTSGIAIAEKFKLSIPQVYRIINDAGAGKRKSGKKAPAGKTAAKKKKR